MPSKPQYTCITCRVAFNTAQEQRDHYKTDWHRYNLKRKVVGLPPISAEKFKEKVAAQAAQAVESKKDENIVGLSCKLCQKRFNSLNSYDNHLKSRKHKDAMKKELNSLHDELVTNQQAFAEKDLTPIESEVLEERALKKALNEAAKDLEKPNIITKQEEETKKKRDKRDNPRYRWYRSQVEKVNNAYKMEVNDDVTDDVVMVDDESDWEDMSDDDDDESYDDVDTASLPSTASIPSLPASTTTSNSTLGGVMAKVKIDSDADIESASLVSEPRTVTPTPHLQQSGGDDSGQRLVPPTECLFSGARFPDIESCLEHMAEKYGFFIPELEYCVNLEGLLRYLGEKVGVGNVCLWCNEKGPAFQSLRAVRQHMINKGHCKMMVEGDAGMEYADFYDFRPSYPDYDGDNDDNDMELMSVDDVDGDDVGIFGDTEYELILPSGARIGHRSLLRYYRQSFPTVDRGLTRSRGTPRIERLLAQYKAIGWHGGAGAKNAIKKFDKDVKYVQRMKSKYVQQLGSRNNKTMMRHFRKQYMYAG